MFSNSYYGTRNYKYSYDEISLVEAWLYRNGNSCGFRVEGDGKVYDLSSNDLLLTLNNHGTRLVSWLIRNSYFPEEYGGKLRIDYDHDGPYRYYEDEYLEIYAHYHDDEYMRGVTYSVSRYPEEKYRDNFPYKYTMLRGDKRIFAKTNDLDFLYSIAKILDNPKYIDERYYELHEYEFRRRVSLCE